MYDHADNTYNYGMKACRSCKVYKMKMTRKYIMTSTAVQCKRELQTMLLWGIFQKWLKWVENKVELLVNTPAHDTNKQTAKHTSYKCHLAYVSPLYFR